MAKADDTHFDTYPFQTRAKHAILQKYLPPFFHAQKRWNKRMFFLDGFAGRGAYKDAAGNEVAGSPLLTLQLLADNSELAEIVRVGFIEPHESHFPELERRVAEFLKNHPDVPKPELVQGSFAATLAPFLKDLNEKNQTIVPTFLFVDPCGVDDVDMAIISDVLKRDGCEVFIFFNYAGINRIAGLLQTDRKTPSLVSIFGSQEAVDALAEAVGNKTGVEREKIIVDMYLDALRQASTAEYMHPFRIEYAEKQSASHYLIHASKHSLGFKIMKHVMWEEGRASSNGGEGMLELRQASAGSMSDHMRTDLASLDKAVLDHLKNGPCKVLTFRETWVERPDDFFSEGCYRRRLLSLEKEGKIEVLNKDGKTPFPADKRRPYKGEPSLSSECYVKLR